MARSRRGEKLGFDKPGLNSESAETVYKFYCSEGNITDEYFNISDWVNISD